MTIQEFARLGGKARAAKLTQERRTEIARNAGKTSATKRTSKQAQTMPHDLPSNPNKSPS